MNIKARIVARKIVLVYFYEQYFLQMASHKDVLLSDVDKLEKLVGSEEGDLNIDMKQVMRDGYYDAFDQEIAYLVEQFFSKFAAKEIDFEYIDAVGPHFMRYLPEVEKKVNEYTVTFQYDEMDLIDRVIFVLGYIEYLQLHTPKEIVLNEMVELAKRYGDESSSKLINGIGHKVLTAIQQEHAIQEVDTKKETTSPDQTADG
jgi:N utilization substance protein B